MGHDGLFENVYYVDSAKWWQFCRFRAPYVLGTGAVKLVCKQITLRLAHAHDIVGLPEHAVQLGLAAAGLNPGAKRPPAKISKQRAIGGPDFYFAFLERQELFFFVEEDESLRRGEVLDELLSVVPAIENLQGIPFGLDHYSFVELL